MLFREEGPVSPTPWLGVDLARVPGTNRWVGGRPREPQDTGVITISLAGTGPTAGWYSSNVGATATMSDGNITGYRLDGGPVQT